MVPVKPAAARLCRISDPILPRSRLAPTTATTRGSKKAFIDAVAAVRDRAAALSAKPVGDRERQDHVADPAIDRRGHPKAGAPKDVEHPAVVAQHVGVEGVDALFSRDARPGAPAGACRCRGPAGHRRRQMPLRRDRSTCGSRWKPAKATIRPPDSATSEVAARSRPEVSRRTRVGVERRQRPESGNTGSAATGPRETGATPRRRVPPPVCRQTVDPSRTTTSVVATAFVMERSARRDSRDQCAAVRPNFSMR